MKKTPSTHHRAKSLWLLAATVLTASLGAQAQSSTSGTTMMGFTPGSGYAELGLGLSNYAQDKGVGGFASEDNATSYVVRGGGFFSPNLGVEVGYTDYGWVSNAGGTTRAKGLNFSLVGKYPASPAVNLIGKVGSTYSYTKVSSDASSGIVAGTNKDFGLALGVGVQYMINPQWSAVVQYEAQNMTFAGDRTDTVGNASLTARFHY
jgi:opacity protein-like surface antigen